MKICYLNCSNLFGGIENIILQTLNELCKDNDVCIILPKGAKFLDKFDKRVKIYEYKSYDKRYNIFLYLELARIITKYDILHTHGAKSSQIGYILSKFMNFKFIATKHNGRKGNIFNKIKNVISVSKSVANTIKNKSTVLYFGIKSKNIIQNLPEIFTITAIGRLDYIKGFDILIKEAANLEFDFRLNIYGAGKEQETLQNMIKNLHLENKVYILGFCENVEEVLLNSHIQIISSRNEGLPLTLMEGIFYSNLLISTNVGGINEILDSQFLFKQENLSEFLNHIYKNYDNYKKDFIQKESKFKDILSFDNYILHLKKIYKEI